jgi:glutamate carboxypeptidase
MDRLSELRARTPQMLEHLGRLVEAESPSQDLAAIDGCAREVSAIAETALGATAELRRVDGRTHVLLPFGARCRVLIVGHLDTVWPGGTLARWPFTVEGDRASGPGAFDMKAGIVQGIHALSTIGDLDGVTALFTSDEEIGSPTSTELIRELASDAEAALILEPSGGGALKTGRKGVSMYEIEIAGRAAHAGLEPEKGASALAELAHQVLAVQALADRDEGTTVTPTTATAGTAMNVVPANARFGVDVRVLSAAEQERVDRAMKALSPRLAGTTIRVTGGPNRGPMEPAASAELFALATKVAGELGFASLAGTTVGGASDGNFTASVGCPTLDGLGAVGDGAHAEGEHVVVSEMAPRAALFAGIVEALLRRPPR